MTTQAISLLLAGSIVATSCASTTTIQSSPSGAKVYLNGEAVGTTPYQHTDTRIVGSVTTVELEKEGYQPLVTSFSRDEQADVGAIIGGVFVLVPFLWTMKYKPTHSYELLPANENQSLSSESSPTRSLAPKAEQLRELKQLLDDNIITTEEYEVEKKKILEANK